MQRFTTRNATFCIFYCFTQKKKTHFDEKNYEVKNKNIKFARNNNRQ